MLKNYLLSPLCSTLAPHLSLFQLSFSFNFSASFFCFFSFGQRPFFCFSPLFLFFLCVALYFSAQNTSFSAQTFFSPKTLFSAQNVFASAQNFFQFSPKRFFFLSVQPLFSSSFFYFILFWFSPLFSLSVPPFFLFFSSVYPRPNVLFSCFTSLLFE